MKTTDLIQKDTKGTDIKNHSKNMAYSKNEKKLKEYLSKQDDSSRPSKKAKSDPRSTPDDPNFRRG
jgi:hypothetical protein